MKGIRWATEVVWGRGWRRGGVGRASRCLALAVWGVGCVVLPMRGEEAGAPWSELALAGPEAKLVDQEAGRWERPRGDGGLVPEVTLGTGYRWFGPGDRLRDAAYVRLGLVWPEALSGRLGLEAFADGSATELRYRRWFTETVLVPDPENPSGPPIEQTRRVARRARDRGDVWQFGLGVRPRLAQVTRAGWRTELVGRLGASATVLDIGTVDEVAPGLYGGLAVRVSPWERLSVGAEALVHWVRADDVSDHSLRTGTVGLSLTLGF